MAHARPEASLLAECVGTALVIGIMGACAGSARGTGDHNPSADAALDVGHLKADVAPGGNFDLSLWELQEPVGSPGSPTIIHPAALVGPSGYHDDYFYTDPNCGAMTFWDPESGVTTPNSTFPRSELREMNSDGSEANWPLSGTNTLSATVAVTRVPDHVCIGQVHCGTPLQAGVVATTKPLVELYYYANGDIKVGIENDPAGGQTTYPITNVPLGTRFSYAIQLLGDGTLNLTVNGSKRSFTVPSAFAGYGEYFKAGNYDQTNGGDSTVGAIVQFYALSVLHEP